MLGKPLVYPQHCVLLIWCGLTAPIKKHLLGINSLDLAINQLPHPDYQGPLQLRYIQ